ncbi:hypothetical protein PR202_gb29713 [Eleusine coracana subsp. coracana]|uniref:Uncharacterized protein n=1 Tax=Eleusine coracana subsp. coracana TaxID=191504 RepID=A0AAV5G0M0_ELECO|nr:hypothetical protein QOZ80_9AG0670010 [Eleusine coracana subsp. coracana]GJN40492.1 hypothetical protein PR202_gb29713 [Eleusine coracana subsp. coracana]
MRTMTMMMPGSRRRQRCPLLDDDGGETELFCASLVEGLAHLERTLQVVDGGVSMRWCADAMRMVKRMQRDMLAIFRNADDVSVSVSGEKKGGCCWFEHYMQETAALLDLCNELKAAVSRMHRYCMLVDLAAASRSGDGWAAPPPPVAAVRDKLTSVKAEWLGKGNNAGGGMVVVALVAKITMAVVSVLVLQALTSSRSHIVDVSPLTGGGGIMVPEELEPWHRSLSLIHGRFPSRVTVVEHDKVSMAVQHDGGDRQQLRARSGELREGVEMFDAVLDEVFDEVIRGRNEMLGILRDKVLT